VLVHLLQRSTPLVIPPNHQTVLPVFHSAIGGHRGDDTGPTQSSHLQSLDIALGAVEDRSGQGSYAEGEVQGAHGLLSVGNPLREGPLSLGDVHELPVVEPDGVESGFRVPFKELLERVGYWLDVFVMGRGPHV